MKNNIWIGQLIVLGFLLMLTYSCKKDDGNPTPTTPTTVTDVNGNVYHTVTIGTQVWMVENLKTTKYRNGDPVANVSDNTQWGALTTGAYCDYNNDANNSITYGKLYNWYAATDSRKLAPIGWHVPSDAEWETLRTYLGGQTVTGGKIKEAGNSHWKSPNTGATNETGFTALPGGSRLINGAFYLIYYDAYLWSTTENTSANAWAQFLYYDGSNAYRNNPYKRAGFSVRCLMD